jgi:hypothetical protein
MTSPEILAEAAHTHAMLSTSRTSAQGPRFWQMPKFEVFADLPAHPNAEHAVTTPISPQHNEALGQVEEELLHQGTIRHCCGTRSGMNWQPSCRRR